jgi:hypothetical protein
VSTFLSRDIATFAGSREKFCDVCGPQFDISSDMGIVYVSEKLFDVSLVQHIVQETNKWLNVLLHLLFVRGSESGKA